MAPALYEEAGCRGNNKKVSSYDAIEVSAMWS